MLSGKSLHFANLSVLELDILADALHHYSNVSEIHISESWQKFSMQDSG